MSKEILVFIFGITLTFLPFLGIPLWWRQYIIAGIGIGLIIIGYVLRRAEYLRRLDKGNGERGTDVFVETTEKPFTENKLE